MAETTNNFEQTGNQHKETRDAVFAILFQAHIASGQLDPPSGRLLDLANVIVTAGAKIADCAHENNETSLAKILRGCKFVAGYPNSIINPLTVVNVTDNRALCKKPIFCWSELFSRFFALSVSAAFAG